MQSNSFDNTINSIRFNSDHSCLSLATNKGFKIYLVQPFQLKQSRDFGAPLQIAAMINRSNLLALVGFRSTPFAPPEKLAIFDDNTQRIVADLTFKSQIKEVVISQNKIVVGLFNKVFIVDLFTMQVQHVIQTCKFQQNQKYNMISLSNKSQNFILAAPGLDNGQVKLVYFSRGTQRTIKAHQSILSAITLSQNGDKLATSSQKGIQIRIFDTKTGDMLQQVRRGNQFATIYSLVFSQNGKWLAVSSDSFNVHIFYSKQSINEKQSKYQNLVEQSISQQLQNPRPLLYFMKNIFPYFDAEYSYSYYKIQDFATQMQSILGFSYTHQHLFLVNNYGNFQRIEINQKGGKCRLIEKRNQI